MGMAAQAASLVPLGQAVGIQMTTAGVLVTDLAEVDTPDGTCTPAKDAGLRPGDVICRMDGQEIVSSADFLAALDAAGDTVTVTVRRGGAEITAAVTPAVMPDGIVKAFTLPRRNRMKKQPPDFSIGRLLLYLRQITQLSAWRHPPCAGFCRSLSACWRGAKSASASCPRIRY